MGITYVVNELFDFSYFQKAVEGTRFAKLNSTNFNNKQIEIDLLHWKRIVCFYTLRLMFAPHGKNSFRFFIINFTYISIYF